MSARRDEPMRLHQALILSAMIVVLANTGERVVLKFLYSLDSHRPIILGDSSRNAIYQEIIKYLQIPYLVGR
jgi:hypothetical protein